MLFTEVQPPEHLQKSLY